VGTYDGPVYGLLQIFLGYHNAVVVADCRLGSTRLRGNLKYAIQRSDISTERL